MGESTAEINGGTKMATIELVDIECPACGSSDYLSFHEDYDNEWITLLCECLHCNTRFQINYRAVGVEKITSEANL